MKILLEVSMDCNDLPKHNLKVDGKRVAFICDLSDCPEDAHIGRDLIDGNDIIKFIKMGFGAAKNGEQIEVEIIDI